MQNIKVVSFAEGPIDGLLVRINPRVEMIVQRDQLPPHVMAKYQKYLAVATLDGAVESLGSEVDQKILREIFSWSLPAGQVAHIPVVKPLPKEEPKPQENEDGKPVTGEVKAEDLAFVDTIEPAKPTSETPEFYKKSENRKNKKRN